MEFKEPEPVKRVPVVPTLPIASATTGSPRKLYVKSDNMLLGRNNLSRSNMPSPTKKRPLPQGTSLYSPRWIVSVKRETDRQVKTFLEALMAPDLKDSVSAAVLETLVSLGNNFLRLGTNVLGEASREMVRTLQHLPTSSARDKILVVQLMLVISSCSRLDQYIEGVREAERTVKGTIAPSRHGYDGQMEYIRGESPRFRDSQNKRANFLSVSLDGEHFDSLINVANQAQLYDVDPEKKLCRICEELIENPIYDEHIKFCKARAAFDVEVLNVDHELTQLASSLQADSVLRGVLQKSISISTKGSGSFYECLGLKKELVSLVEAGRIKEKADVLSKARDLMHRKMVALQSSEKVVLQSPRLPSPKMSDSRRSARAKIPSIADFEIIKPITRGGYGGVYLARKKATNDLYAIKALNRKEMIKRGEMQSILAERNILATLHSEFVVKMFFAMASKRYLFFVMEYMAGGDCFSLLRKFGRLDEGIAKFYIAEVVLALEDIHRQGVVHRDVKPDNILIGADGHVKLADFGLSAMGLMNKQSRDNGVEEGNKKEAQEPEEHKFSHERGAVKGTPHYLAPEILLGLPHGQAVDWWSLGVMLFEFCNGYPPFSGETVEDVFSEILSGHISWPLAEHDEMSGPCKQLITRLLDIDQDKRLQTAVRVKAHPFFGGIDWLDLPHEEPPFVPERSSETDTSAFNERSEFFRIEPDPAVGDERSSSESEEEEEEEEERKVTSEALDNLPSFWHINFQNLASKK